MCGRLKYRVGELENCQALKYDLTQLNAIGGPFMFTAEDDEYVVHAHLGPKQEDTRFYCYSTAVKGKSVQTFDKSMKIGIRIG